jgi:DNA-binding transcriptional LysR family regulator
MFAWDDLRYFLAAYRAGSLGRACEALEVSPSTVSRRLAALEEALGGPLFVRTPEGLIATPAGQAMVAEAEAAEASIARIRQLGQVAAERPSGVVRVSMPGDMTRLVLVGVLAELRRAYPELIVEIIETHELADLARIEVDIAVRMVRPSAGDLVFTRLRETQLAMFAARSLIDELGPDPLALPWITWIPELELAEAKWLAGNLPDIHVVSRVNSLTTMRLLAGAGVGAALLPRLFGRHTANLVELVSPVPLPPTQPLWLVCNAALRQIPRIAAVWTFLDQELRARPVEVEDELLRERLARSQGIHVGGR